MSGTTDHKTPFALHRALRKGSLTIEAACIMPVVLLVCFTSLYFCFHVHNRVFLTAAAYESAVCGSIEAVKEKGDPYETARERSLFLGNTGFFGAQDIHTQTTAGTMHGERIAVTYELGTVFRVFKVEWNLRAEGEAFILDPVSEIRRARGEG